MKKPEPKMDKQHKLHSHKSAGKETPPPAGPKVKPKTAGMAHKFGSMHTGKKK